MDTKDEGEFGKADVPLETMAARYLGLSPAIAKRQAASASLPLPAYRAGNQKSPWLVRITGLANWPDRERERGLSDWKNRNHP